MIGLGQLALRGKEYLVALKPCGAGMLLETLHYEEEIRKADPFFSDISKAKADDELLAVAKQLIERKTAPFDAGCLQGSLHEGAARADRARSSRARSRRRWRRTKSAPAGGNVIDLMAALKAEPRRRSGEAGCEIEVEARAPRRPPRAAAKPQEQRPQAGRRESAEVGRRWRPRSQQDSGAKSEA